jgi:hypothetical protein
VVVSGIIIDPTEMNPTDCYEVIGFQAKSKAQIYTFFKLLFSNPNLETDIKV